MIPVQLTLEGLYSYQERQIIDFKNLTEAGLFGIFGAVGSGKSSILEAISFALYGETERLNLRDRRAYNMMNLKCNNSFIQFDFINHENKTFRATRDFKRNSKKFDDVKPSSTTFYEKTDGKWIPLDHSNAEEIIGLSYANFKRTIIIPQGQFKEFLELGAADRTNMMKEIFNLQQFDLQHNTSALNLKNRSELDQLEGQLKGFEEVNEEQISAQEESLKLEKEKLAETKIQFQKTEAKHQQLKNLKTDFELLNSKKQNFEKLKDQKNGIDELEETAEIFEKVFQIFNPLITEKNKIQIEISTQQTEKEIQENSLKISEKKHQELSAQITKISPKYDALNQSKTEENDLGLILQIIRFSEEIQTLEQRTKNGSEKVDEVEEKLKKIRQSIDEYVKNSKTLKPKKIDAVLLLNVGNWFSARKNLTDSFHKQANKTELVKSQIEQISDELKAFNINTESFLADFKVKTEELDSEKKHISDKRNHLEVQQKLAHYASVLHDGKPCPLCGALEHPTIIEFNDLNTERENILNQLESIEKQQNEIHKQALEIGKILDREKFLKNQLTEENEILSQIKVQLKNHQQQFLWKQFSAENEADFNQKREESFAIEKQLETLNQKIADEQKNLENEQENLSKFNKALADFKLKENEVETKIKTNESNLKILRWNDYKDKTYPEVHEIHERLAKYNLETEENYKDLIKQEKDLSPKLAEQRTNVSNLKKRISELKKEIEENENSLTKSLTEQNFKHLDEIQPILSQPINVPETRTRIQNFRIDFETLKNGILELETKLKDFNFDEKQFTETENQFKSDEMQYKLASDAVVKRGSEIERLIAEFKKKEHLLNDLTKLQKRAENLKIMTNLFKGAGFVQYVSSIYLRQLCDHANIRFHRMTRNQLSLQLNENNDFEIIDYLNEGRCRSVKTLSGGQAFQVSLSLALALAESVQANAKAEKNFFFIDEGFGTQDLESVNVVFETLMSLQKENRIVGIISHVEELKEKIPVSLTIVKDEERGSLIEVV